MATIFDLHKAVLRDYEDFVSSFVAVADARVREFVQKLLVEDRQLWPEPLLQLSPAYKLDATVAELAKAGLLQAETARIFCRPDGDTYRLYRHQVEAIRLAQAGRSFVLTSGTGSGKTFCYFIPIVDAVVRRPDAPGPMAIVVYPMNALANSQLGTLQQLKDSYEARYGCSFPLRFARYTGETPEEEREQIRRDPPHLILTNYVMAELMLVRPEDRPLIQARPDSDAPFFLVFDELHTYRGRQGADVAMLVRRLRARLQRRNVVHIGTSATLVAHRDATPEERREVVAEFASRFFGTKIGSDAVVEETLEPVTIGGPPNLQELRQALAGPLPEHLDALCTHALARWVEFALGIKQESDGRYRRREPRPFSEAVAELAGLVNEPEAKCREALENLLTRAAELNRKTGQPFFAFKLHQFISQGRGVHATLEPPQVRSFSRECTGSAGRVFYPLRFCRICGHDYYHVLRRDDAFLPYPEDTNEFDDGLEPGYVTFMDEWAEDKIPDDWLDERGKVTRTWRERVPRPVWVRPDGTYSTEPLEGAPKAWWQPRKLWLCLRCGEFYSEKDSEFTKLCSLSSEGRSSATTVLAVALLRHAAKTGAARAKLLSFTDSRQDASLQAGHFNDFVHMAVLRSSLFAALRQHRELRFHNVAEAVVKQMGLQLSDVAQTRSLDPNSSAAHQVWETFRDLIEYRIYADLRRGWRVVQPNLEDVGLLKIEYDGLEALCASEETWRGLPHLYNRPALDRTRIVRAVLDYFRKRLAIETRVLEESFQQGLVRRAEQLLNEFWGIDPENGFMDPATCFVRDLGGGGEPQWRGSFYRLSYGSRIGRFLADELGLNRAEFEEFIRIFLETLVRHGFLRRLPALNGFEPYRLDAACLVWRLGDGTPPPDPVYDRADREVQQTLARVNAFFKSFYQLPAGEIACLEAREHTAQVVAPGERERRERRFRWLPADQQDPELGRRLPYLVCSPTMELGIDIADLDMVHMRNVPPTPANYAQRSGRAARQGQPGLIVTYCAAGSSHDQYFFANKAEMVAGAVRAPQLDLANEALIRAHVQAEWLAQVALPLRKSIEEVIDTGRVPELPIRENVAQQLQLGTEARGRLRERLERILESDAALLQQSGWFTPQWLENVIEKASQRFDEAFERWRELYRIATTQLERAQQELARARAADAQQRARMLQEEALRQRNLLLQIEVAREESDFYPYRYLATEGFLPGYNFPTLPVRAWVPRGQGEFISRPRYLAISEFAPHNIVYHEGAKWQVRQFASPPGGLAQRRTQRRLCRECGAFSDSALERCPVCNVLFDAANSEILQLLDLPNVKLLRHERITCNEEERIRRGYHLEVAYQFAPAGTGFSTVEADVLVHGKPAIYLTFGPAATVLYINRGWKSRPTGFPIDITTGELFTESQIENFARTNHRTRSGNRLDNLQRLALCTWQTQNVLLVQLLGPQLCSNSRAEISLMYALKRGIECAFQLEERELGLQKVGQPARHAFLFYEAAEGGLGVLRRLVEEPDALTSVARAALQVCHFDEQGTDRKPECAQACYECLLSYTNQTDAFFLDRRLVCEPLRKLLFCTVAPRVLGRTRAQHLEWLLSRAQSDFERAFIKALDAGGYRLPDDAQKSFQEPRCIADFFYKPNVAVFCDGPAHDKPDQQRLDQALRRELLARGYRVLTIRWDKDLKTQLQQWPEVFGPGG